MKKIMLSISFMLLIIFTIPLLCGKKKEKENTPPVDLQTKIKFINKEAKGRQIISRKIDFTRDESEEKYIETAQEVDSITLKIEAEECVKEKINLNTILLPMNNTSESPHNLEPFNLTPVTQLKNQLKDLVFYDNTPPKK
jgi:hypothetical protein